MQNEVERIVSPVVETMPFRVRGMSVVRVLTPLALFIPGVALAAPATFQELAMEIIEILDLATITLIVFGLVAYFWGMSINVTHMGGDDKDGKRKSFLLWGVIILFVMVSVWGIIQLLQNTLFGNQAFDPSTGTPATEYCYDFDNC